MRKLLLLFLVLFLTAVCACAAAETEYTLEHISGKISFNEDIYIVLTPSNLSEHPDLLSELGKTQEALQADWKERGVQLQAWSKDKKNCVEISVFQDEDSSRYYDLEQQSNTARKQYYKEQLTSIREKGYIIVDSEIKLHSKSGHYAVFEYILNEGEAPHRGIGRKIVRNGYTMFMDYQVYDRKPTKTDKDRSRHIVNTIVIDTVSPSVSASSGQDTDSGSSASSAPSSAAGTLNVTVLPPAETNTGVFTIEGTAYPGSRLIVVAMRWSGTAYRFYADASKAGNFKAKITLPDEGLYQFTINMDINDTPVADAVLNAVTYSKTLLPVTVESEIPEQLNTDELVISGTTDKGVTIQCIVTNGITTFDKIVTTNGTGKFRFKVPTAAEADYDITLAFSKKNLNTKRLNFKTTRKLSAEEKQADTEAGAIHPAYATLVKKLDTYIGATMVYNVFVTDVQQIEDEWVITTALKLNRGVYSNFLIFMAGDNPGLAAGSKVKMYGTCVGAYQIQSEEGDISYPGFDYLFFK